MYQPLGTQNIQTGSFTALKCVKSYSFLQTSKNNLKQKGRRIYQRISLRPPALKEHETRD